jgi:hypothetical protein
MPKHNRTKEMPEVADTNLEPRDFPLNDPVPMPNDPGGAHSKGYSPDADSGADANPTGPIPLATAPEEAHIHQPELEGKVTPTGPSEPRGYTPNDRLMGSDR